MNRMKIKLLIGFFLCSGIINAFGQDTLSSLSLSQCLKIGLKNNISVVKAQMDVEKNNYKLQEVKSNGLPQVDGFGSFQDNLQLPVTPMPGDLIVMMNPDNKAIAAQYAGKTLLVPMGIKYNTSGGIKVSQLLYSQTYLTSIDLTKLQNDLGNLSYAKAQETLIYDLSKLYFIAQVTDKQKTLIQDNLNRLEKTLGITQTLLDNGMIRSVDKDRIKIARENLMTQYSNTEALYKQQLDLIKYTMALPMDQKINLTDSVEMTVIQPIDTTFGNDFSNRTDMKLLEKQKELTLLNKKMINQEYLPTLAASGQFYYYGMRNKFDYFDFGSKTNNWYGAASFGLNLSIPIFDGFSKKAKASQALIEYNKACITEDNTKKYFSIEYENNLRNLTTNRLNVERQKQNVDLAERVYDVTSQRYHEGVASMSDLLTDETNLSSAQSSYLNALYNLKTAELDILKSTGDLNSLTTK